MSSLQENFQDDTWNNSEHRSHMIHITPSHMPVSENGLNLEAISIRLQKKLINELKILAREEGIGYQPYIRQFLTHHVRAKKKRRSMPE